MLHGTEIRVAGEDPDRAIIGFHATRLVRGSSEEDAARLAKERICAEWADPRYSRTNLGEPPVLHTDSVARTSLLDRLTFPNKGHVFYAEDDDGETKGQAFAASLFGHNLPPATGC